MHRLKKGFSAVSLKWGSALLNKVKAIFITLMLSSFGFVLIDTSESINKVLNNVVNQKDMPEANIVSVQNGNIVLKKATVSSREEEAKKVESGSPSIAKKNNSTPQPVID